MGRLVPAIRQRILAFRNGERGATAIEYTMIAAFIVLAIVAVLPLIGVTLRDMFQSVMDAFGH